MECLYVASTCLGDVLDGVVMETQDTRLKSAACLSHHLLHLVDHLRPLFPSLLILVGLHLYHIFCQSQQELELVFANLRHVDVLRV